MGGLVNHSHLDNLSNLSRTIIIVNVLLWWIIFDHFAFPNLHCFFDSVFGPILSRWQIWCVNIVIFIFNIVSDTAFILKHHIDLCGCCFLLNFLFDFVCCCQNSCLFNLWCWSIECLLFFVQVAFWFNYFLLKSWLVRFHVVYEIINQYTYKHDK